MTFADIAPNGGVFRCVAFCLCVQLTNIIFIHHVRLIINMTTTPYRFNIYYVVTNMVASHLD